MSRLPDINRELPHFYREYISARDPDFLKRNPDRREVKDKVRELFLGEGAVNPNSIPLAEYLLKTSELPGVKHRLAELRERLDLPSHIPFGQWVSLAESVVTFDDEEVRAKYKDIFSLGLLQSELIDRLRVKHQYEDRDLFFLINNQSGEVNRSLVEIVSNAIDFSQKDGQVTVELGENGYVVTDTGSGMLPENLIENLSIPFISGARDGGKASIGKFGMGFLTILRHLHAEGDRVIVETADKGQGNYRIEFVYRDESIQVITGKKTDIKQGTRITLEASNFDSEDAGDLLKKHLQYKRGANVFLNGENLKRLENIQFLEKEHDSEAISVGYESAEVENDKCEIVIAINGILVFSRQVEGLNFPARLLLDFPYSTNLSESRDFLVYDEIFLRHAQEAIGQVLQSTEDVNTIIQIVNALAEFFAISEANAYESDRSIFDDLETAAGRIVESEELTAVPADKGTENIEIANIALLNNRFSEVFEPFFSELAPVRGFRSDNLRAYVVDFQKGVEKPVVILDKNLLIDRSFYEGLKDHPEFLEEYLKFMCREAGSLYIDRPKTESSKEDQESVFLSESYPERCLEPVLSNEYRIPWFSLNRMFFGHDVLFPDISNNPRESYQWCESLEFSEESLSKIEAFLKGETDDLDLSNVWQRAIDQHRSAKEVSLDPDRESELYQSILANAEQEGEISENLMLLKKLFSFFSPDNLRQYLSSPPELIESRLCRDFVNQFQDVLGTEIQETISRIKRNYRRREDKNEDDEVAIDFEFLYSLIADSFNPESISIEPATLKKGIGKLILWRAGDVISNLSAYTSYEACQSLLGESQSASLDKLLNLDWQKTDITGPDEALKGNILYLNGMQTLQDNRAVLSSLSDVVRTVPQEFIDEMLNLIEEGQKMSVRDFLYLCGVAVDPYISRHLLCSKFTRGSVDSASNVFAMIGDTQRAGGMETVKDLVREERLEPMYWGTGISSYQGYEEYVRTKHEYMAANMVNLPRKIRDIYHLPVVREIFEKRGDELSEQFARDLRDVFTYPRFEAYSVYEAFDNTEGLFASLSQRKLEIIERTMEENFDPDFMDRQSCLKAAFYLRRVVSFCHLPDDDFELIQDWLMVLKKNIQRYVFVKEVCSEEIIGVLLENKSKISKVGMDKLVEIWSKVISVMDFDRKPVQEQVEILRRIINIVEDITLKPKSLQDYIFGTLKQIPGSYNEWEYFTKEVTDVSKVPYLIQPYVIYFREGDRKILEENILSGHYEKGENSFKLAELMHLKRAAHNDFLDSLSDPESLASTARESAEGINKFVYIRELLHSVQHLPANDSYLFIRELIQNAYDASMEDPDEEPHKISVNSFQDGNAYVVTVSDTIGMDFETIFSKLLIPNISSKERVGQLGRFGVGFMSIFRDAERVEISSSKDGKNTTVVIEPVKDESGQLIDLEVHYSVSDADRTGTIIRKFSKAGNSHIENAKVKAATYRYGSYLTDEQVLVNYENEQINKDSESRILSSLSHPELGSIEILEGQNNSLLQGRLYVAELPEYLQDIIPDNIKDLVVKHGLVVNLDKEIALTRSRKDLSDRARVLPALEGVLPGMIIEATIKKFARGNFDLKMIPYDYFWSFEGADQAWREKISPEIQADAELINQGMPVSNWERYSDRVSFLELLTLISFVEIGGQKRSLQGVNDLRKSGYDFSDEKLPPAIKDLLENSKNRDKEIAQARKNFERDGERSFQFMLIDLVRETLRSKADSYLAFSEIVNAITYQKGVSHAYFNLPNVARAFASEYEGLDIKAWNLLYCDDSIRELASIIKAGEPTDQNIYRFLSKIIYTSTHEDTHLALGMDHWGFHHNDIFWEEQERIWTELMLRHGEIVDTARAIMSQYNGDYLERRELLQLV